MPIYICKQCFKLHDTQLELDSHNLTVCIDICSFIGKHKPKPKSSKYCIFNGCTTYALFNNVGEKKALYCSVHKLENMIDIKHKRCIHEGCTTRPIFNIPTETVALYCSTHKLENMIDIKNKRCIHEGCTTRPTFNIPTETVALYCSIHKLENMIDIKHKRCIHEGCTTRPTFNIPTETVALYCSVHKLENMIDIRSKRCIHEDCTTRPTFNIPTESKPLYCAKHKLDNMINIKNKDCQHLKCKNTPLFGLINKRPQFCYQHKKPNMINLILENKCNVPDCDHEFDYIFDNIKYCSNHHPDPNNLDVVKRLCKYCEIKADDCKYVCERCKRVRNKKEWAIVRYLRTAIDTEFIYDSSKMLQSCSKKRPDIFFDLPKHCVIVEIDENQHNSYEDVCECARLNEIVNGIGGRSVIIIRYNPDIIKNNGKEVNILQSTKIDLLVKTIKEQLICDYDTFVVKTIQLYYNDNYEQYEQYKEEIITDLVCI